MNNTPSKRYCLALDLKNDAKTIATYKEYHRNVWPEIEESIKSAGIQHAEIYCVANRLFMILEVGHSFSFERKAKMDEANPKVQEWEALMWKYQQAIPVAKPGEKWLLMDKIYQL
jgi:L-rhamnose mutarotase